MKRVTIAVAALFLSVAVFAADTPSNSGSTSAFERLKQLAGEWETRSGAGTGRASYKVIAGGSAVVEEYRAAEHPDQEMVTVFYLDRGQLVLTHYCMAGNQPRMRVQSFDPATGRLAFEFAGGSNVTPQSGHMHSARIQFRDGEHFTSNWQFVENSKLKFAEDIEYTRVK